MKYTMKSVWNPTDESFTWEYDREPYTIEPKAVLETTDFVADHLAKHLANKMLHEMEDPSPNAIKLADGSRPKIANVYTHPLREKVLEQIYGGPETWENTRVDVPVDNSGKKKMGRPKKVEVPVPEQAPL